MMMELTCALVLVASSVVTATPYGYGVKSGAAAKADAGAFAGVPINGAPLGHGGYSGSYSKSSASSYASSSASSSSSSFSYSGSGSGGYTGTNGFVYPGSIGCSSGDCHNNGGNDLNSGTYNNGAYNSGSAGNGFNSFGGSHAVASSGASAAAGGSYGSGTVPCTGADCNTENKDCTPGSGSCKLGTYSTNNNSPNDIPATVGYGSNNKANGQSSAYGKGDSGSGLGCTNGACGSSASIPSPSAPGCINGACGPSSSVPSSSNSPTSSSTIPISSPEINPPKCNSPHCSDALSHGTPQATGSGIPATYLTTPKEGPLGSYPDTQNLPSSYNVPIHGPPTSQEKTPSCTSGNCVPQPSTITSPNDGKTESSTPGSAYDFPDFLPLSPNKPTNCATGNCPTSSLPGYNYGLKAPASSGSPAQNYPGQRSTPVSGKPGYNCGSTNCAGTPGYSSPQGTSGAYTGSFSGATANSGTYTGGFGGPKNDGQNTPSFGAVKPKPVSDTGIYTGGFGGPKDATGVSPIGQNIPVYTGGFGGPKTDGQNTPGYGGAKPIPNADSGIYTGGFGGPKDSTGVTPTLPVYTGGFGAPTTEGQKTPGYGGLKPTTTPGANTGVYTGGFGGPKDGTSLKPTSLPTPSGNVPSALPSYAGVKPTTSASSTTSQTPVYSGGFGGPSGYLRPHEYDLVSKPGSIPQQPTNKPKYPSDSASQPSTNVNYPTNIPASNNPKPSSSPGTPLNKPNGTPSSYGPHSVSYPGANTPTSQPQVTPTKPGTCAYGNCGPQANTAYNYGSSGSTSNANSETTNQGQSCAFGNCASQPGHSLPHYGSSSVPTGPNPSAIPASNAYNKPKTPQVTSNTSPGCTSGNCSPQPGTNYGSGGSSPSNVPCSSGNCGTHNALSGATSGASAIAGASASADAIVYTGGFGGPPGVLKPNDGGKLTGADGAGIPSNKKHDSQYDVLPGSSSLGSGGIHPSYSHPGTGGGSGYHGSGAAAQAGAVAGATSGSYGGSGYKGNQVGSVIENGDDIQINTGCGGGCGSYGGGNYGLGRGNASAKSLSSAVSGASAGSYAQAGSFASSSASAYSGAATKGGYGRR